MLRHEHARRSVRRGTNCWWWQGAARGAGVGLRAGVPGGAERGHDGRQQEQRGGLHDGLRGVRELRTRDDATRSRRAELSHIHRAKQEREGGKHAHKGKKPKSALTT